MSQSGFAFFATAIGRCGIAWNARGIVAIQLPERHDGATRTRLLRRCPSAEEAIPQPQIGATIEAIIDLLAGGKPDFSEVTLDMTDIPPMAQQVYAIAREIPAGGTLSYGEIATRLGDRALARDVGEALGRNPFPLIVPCHRVLAAGGRLGGFSAAGGVTTKLRLLEIEGATIGPAPTLFDSLPLMARR